MSIGHHIPMASAHRLVFYIGGFAPVGGIETFVRDLLLVLAKPFPRRELVYWGDAPAKLPQLTEIAKSGARLTRSFVQVGCRWNVPDHFLQWWAGPCLQRADMLIFKKPPPLSILRRLRRTASRLGRHIPFVMIAPYRPSEYWGENPGTACFEPFEAISVQSEAAVDDLRRFGYTGRISNIPLLPPPTEPLANFPPITPGEPMILGFLGRLEKQKNLGYLLRCYQHLTQSLPRGPYELHLFGDGAEQESLMTQVVALSLSNVHFHGRQERGEINAAIDSCHLFLNTSTREGQCLVALEVLNRGRPFVATPSGSLPEILADPRLGRLAPLDDPAAFAASVVGVASEIREGRLCPASIFEAFQSRFDQRAIASAYVTLFNTLLTVPYRSYRQTNVQTNGQP